ncbi:MAG: SRPBCC domain-containing protein [Chloroflexi bacterium]|nr:SRPBCC domain-containing protein [Chloroflexota bacterium]
MELAIRQKYNIKASPADVWRALTDPKEIQEWSGATAYFVPIAGARYTLWNGTIGGKIVEAVPEKKLVQTWKPEDWTREDSVVTFTLTWGKGATRVDLLHENVEESDFDGTTEGWDIYYLGEIKKMLEARGTKVAKETKGAKAAKKGASKKAKAKSGKKPAKKKSAGKKPAKKK